MVGSDSFFGSLDLIQVESAFFFLLLMRMALDFWQSIHRIKPSSSTLDAKIAIPLLSIIAIALIFVFVKGLGENYLLLGIEFGLSVTLCFIRPVYAVSFFIALLFLRPWEIMSANSVMLAMPRFIGLLSIGAWLLNSLLRQKLNIAWNRSAKIMLFLLMWLLLSTLKSPDLQDGINLFVDSFLRVAIIYFVVTNCIQEISDFRLVRDTILLSATGLGAIALYQHFTSLVANGRLTAVGNLENSNDLAAIMILVLPMAMRPILEKKLSLINSITMVFFLSLTLSAVWLAQSRGAILAMLTMLAAFMLLRMKNKRLGIMMAMLVALCFIPLRMSLHRDSEDISESTESRLNYWKAGFSMALYNPLLGVGFGNYPQNFEKYASEIKFESGHRTAHSTWILALAEAGIPAVIALLSLYFLAMQDAYALRVSEPDLLYALIGYGVAISFLSHTYLIYPYILIAITAAAARVYRSVLVGSVALALILFSTQAAVAEEMKLSASLGADKPIGKLEPKTSNSLELSGSRGESLNFLLKIQQEGCHRIWVDSSSELKNKDNKQRWQSINFSLFEMPKIKTQHASFPGAYVGDHVDPLIPVVGGRVCGSGWIFGEVNIGKDSLAGKLQGQILVENGPELAWTLEVWPMTMPEFPSLPAYSELTTWFNLLGHYGDYHEGEGILAKQYAEEMKRHRIYPLKMAVARPKVVALGNDQYTLDIVNTPNVAESFSRIVLEADKLSHIDFPSFDAKESEEATIHYWKAVENIIQKHNLQERAICYFWDEPAEKDIGKLLRQAYLAKKYAPDLKLLVTNVFDARLAKYVDIFSPVMNYFDTADKPKPEVYKKWRGMGKEIWWYVSCMSHGCTRAENPGIPDMVIDRPASWIRSIGWLSAKYGIDAFLYYSVNNGYQFAKSRDPWKDLWDFHGNGDGTLFYPGKPNKFPSINSQMPIVSLRMKLWRESSFDAEYIGWMNALDKKPVWWPAEFNKLVQSPTVWQKDYSAYQALRNKMGHFLSEQKP